VLIGGDFPMCVLIMSHLTFPGSTAIEEPITIVSRSETRTVLSHSNSGVMGSKKVIVNIASKKSNFVICLSFCPLDAVKLVMLRKAPG
jgi:hypothetical protein